MGDSVTGPMGWNDTGFVPDGMVARRLLVTMAETAVLDRSRKGSRHSGDTDALEGLESVFQQ